MSVILTDASLLSGSVVLGLKDKHLLVTITSGSVVLGTDSFGLYGVHLLVIVFTCNFVVVDVFSYGLHVSVILIGDFVFVASVVLGTVVVGRFIS